MPYSQRADGFDELRHELALLPDRILEQGEKIVSKGMLNIKKDAQDRVRAARFAHLPKLARSFSYDVTRGDRLILGVAGADTARGQGALDAFIENGTAKNAAHPHWGPALDAELPKFEKYAEEYLAELVT